MSPEPRLLPQILASVQKFLPVHSEEVQVAEEVLAQKIQEAVVLDLQISEDRVQGVLELLEHMWRALGLLDVLSLKGGCWKFTSFPASLMARSLLESLSQERPELLEPGFWLPGQREDVQRRWLSNAETQRLAMLQEHARPIRQVHVAWGLIRLQGKLLVNHREDESREERPNYVIIGGKLNLYDLEDGSSQLSREALVRLQQAPPGEQVQQALLRTLERELREELGLLPQHYEARHFHSLQKPYQEIEGARANHALTRYDISCFQIRLHASGFKQLCRKIRDSPQSQLLWMTPEEMALGSQADRRVYVEAWLRDAGSRGNFQKQLERVEESFTAPPRYSKCVDIPVAPDTAFLVGETGKESKVHVDLDERARLILMGMAWHAVNASLQEPPPAKLTLHPLGWIEFRDAGLLEEVRKLQELLDRQELTLLQGDDPGWFRVSVAPENLYLSEEFFQVKTVFAEEKRYEVHLSPFETQTPIGRIPSDPFILKVPEKIYQLARDILEGRSTSVEVSDPKRSFRADVNTPARKFGLRIVFRSRKSEAEFYTDCNSAE